jgi:hypothetical protein
VSFEQACRHPFVCVLYLIYVIAVSGRWKGDCDPGLRWEGEVWDVSCGQVLSVSHEMTDQWTLQRVIDGFLTL